ncbi:MAG: TetR/AcrR family transcriptional regulator [Notoacmeibacter sp.]|nr:TetR/AcrR family transcriptional regulator [Notoacmeibacter sp.]
MDKRAQILDQAMDLVMRYGYGRVTMDDIARAAGMSRPALYQFFRNKTDIYRGLASDMHEHAVAAAKAVLEGPGSARERIEKAIRVGLLDIMAKLEESQHGAELVDVGNELCADIIDKWISRKVALLSVVYDDAASCSPFTGEMLALQLMDWLDGMKCRVHEPQERIAALRAFLDMQFAAMAEPARAG